MADTARAGPAGLRIVLALILALCVGCGETSDPDAIYLLDLSGQTSDPFSIPGVAANVFLFTRTDCPISNRYAPEVQRLHAEFAPRGIRFWMVYPDPDEQPEAIRRHLEEYGYAFDALRDVRHTLVRRTGATVTPEAAVFTAAANMPYRGRIDDRFPKFGTARPAATVRDLQDVLEAILAGQALEPRTTRAVGCFIPDLD